MKQIAPQTWSWKAEACWAGVVVLRSCSVISVLHFVSDHETFFYKKYNLTNFPEENTTTTIINEVKSSDKQSPEVIPGFEAAYAASKKSDYKNWPEDEKK